MKGVTLQPEIQALVEQHDRDALHEIFKDWQPADLAELINDMEEEEDQIFLFHCIPAEHITPTFEYLDISLQKQLLESLEYDRISDILNDMSPDDRTALLEELPANTMTQLISLLSPHERSIALKLLDYPEYSVGRLMTPDYVAVRASWTVRQVLDYIRKYGQDSETLNVIYVIDERGYLIDDIRVREFLLAPPERKVSDLMDRKYTSLVATEDQEVAVGFFRNNNRVALPVTDEDGLLLGIITVDDVLVVAEEEDTEDIQKIGAVEALENPYLDIPIPEMVRKRVSWLVVLFIGEMFTATAMGFFENEIAKAVVLALFVPLIISSGGNSGSQAATLIIRAMALGEVTLRDWWHVMRREIISGLLLGVILGIIGFLRIAVWTTFSSMYGPHWLGIAITVGLSLIGVVLWGSLTGSMLPLLLRRLGLDPATSSAPFVATLVDVTGLVIYFSFALLLLQGKLL